MTGIVQESRMFSLLIAITIHPMCIFGIGSFRPSESVECGSLGEPGKSSEVPMGTKGSS